MRKDNTEEVGVQARRGGGRRTVDTCSRISRGRKKESVVKSVKAVVKSGRAFHLRDYTAVAAISGALERVHRVSESTARAEDLSFNEGDPVGQMSRSGVLTDFRDNDVCRLSRPRRPWARFNEWEEEKSLGASRR